MNSRLNQYLETSRDSARLSNETDTIMRDISSKITLLVKDTEEADKLLDMIIHYGSRMEHKGFESGYTNGKQWPK